MPVQKFKSFQDAEEALWCLKPDQAYYDRMGDLWEIAGGTNPLPFLRGVFKFRSIEEANKHMDDLILKHALDKQKKLRKSQ